ncbi:glucose-methanol-choline (gmc) oxidoreductase [Penicillium verhagenii]|uniref:glucose-methanol-choline (gmc) oxidoreductase n=1 Tax=Penicillium verhagenii TaxID=1562060 RepID=UPI0025458024|nr:glucose-methanol-choline (gmc) oxidoreductase [Penicillium verhagenii]KAJ5934718.1 glucose-methanol-choline (gmc) oxidoreductase [Penicillium verhagenii]
MASSLPQNADYLIIGGGTSGLVVANRLSEDPNIQVVVLESGPDRTSDPRVKDPNAWPTLAGSELDWQLKTVPQTGLNNREQNLPAGKMLGGSSALNGLVWVPPSRAGIDAWADLGNPDWNWESLLPYLQKSYSASRLGQNVQDGTDIDRQEKDTIRLANPARAEKSDAPVLEAWNKALEEQGYDFSAEILGGQKTVGSRDFIATIDPSGSRSSADSTYARVDRPNLHIVTEATVRKILLAGADDEQSTDVVATGVEVEVDGQIITLFAKKEVILAAGGFHTPKLLELSGIGQKDRLTELGIPVLIDLPGVGENLQNHIMAAIPTQLKIEGITPGIKATAFTRLDKDNQEHVFSLSLSSNDNTQSHEHIIKSILRSPDEASAFYIFGVMPGGIAILGIISSFPFSRGSVHISSSEFDVKSDIDVQALANEMDIEILARHVQNMQKLASSPALEHVIQPFESPVELEALKEALREAIAALTDQTSHMMVYHIIVQYLFENLSK